MDLLQNILYLVSTSFLIPVIILLIILFINALMLAGSFYGIYINRLKYKKELNRILSDIENISIKDSDFSSAFKGNSLFLMYLKRIQNFGWHPIHSAKLISEYEIKAEKELEKVKTLNRLGPMLGLMGTLIPMGPALMGLATGDIASMANNMQVAFSTTVIGIVIGAVGFAIHMVRQRWFAEDLNNMEYFYELSQLNEVTDEKKKFS